MKKLLLILFALPMLWGCKDKESEIQQPLTFWEQLIVDATAVVNQVIADYGDYKAEEVAELLCGKMWHCNSFLECNENWSKIIAVGVLQGTAYMAPANFPTYQFYDNGKIASRHSYDSADGELIVEEKEGVWSYDASRREVAIDWPSGTEVWLIKALGKNVLCFDFEKVYQYDNQEPFSRNYRYIYIPRLTE